MPVSIHYKNGKSEKIKFCDLQKCLKNNPSVTGVTIWKEVINSLPFSNNVNINHLNITNSEINLNSLNFSKNVRKTNFLQCNFNQPIKDYGMGCTLKIQSSKGLKGDVNLSKYSNFSLSGSDLSNVTNIILNKKLSEKNFNQYLGLNNFPIENISASDEFKLGWLKHKKSVLGAKKFDYLIQKYQEEINFRNKMMAELLLNKIETNKLLRTIENNINSLTK